MQLRTKALVVAGAASFLAAPAMAHHSYAMFDMTKNVTIEGTVKDFQWTNPHTFVQLDVKDAAGKDTNYAIETSSPNALYRQGWTRKSAKAGDHAVIVMHPLRDGSTGGSLVTMVVNGKKIGTPVPGAS